MSCVWCDREHDGGPERCLVGVLLVCGGRDYKNRDRVFEILDKTAARVEILAVRHGACPRGADKLADEWARDRGYTVQAFPARWGDLGPSAGPTRNAEMANTAPIPVCAVAFPGGRGTENMIRNILSRSIPLWRVS